MDGYADHAVSLDEAKCDGADPSLEHEAALASGDGVTCPLCMVDDILHLNGVFFCRCGFRIDCKVSTAMSVCTGEAGGACHHACPSFAQAEAVSLSQLRHLLRGACEQHA